MKPDIVVIGGGAAGIMAAWRAATLGARVTLLEKTPRLGTKILVSGGGKCNITHDGPVEDVLRSFRPNEARFLRPSFYRWNNQQLIEMFTAKGLEVYTRPNGRVFPVDQTAKAVVAILQGYLRDAGVEVRLGTAVRGLIGSEAVTGVQIEGGVIEARRVVLSTGGSSYPNSGTTGDGWPWARQVGHSIVKVRAALAPIYLHLDQDWIQALSGVALRDVVLKARSSGKVVDHWRGDLLFTHHGISGPTALEISRVVAERMIDGETTLWVDAVPDRTPEDLAGWLAELALQHPKRRAKTLLDGMVPESVAPWMLATAAVDPETPLSQLDRRSRNRFLETLKNWTLGPVRTVPLEKGEVVSGGVSLDEVDPKTMRSLKCEGLYLCGEVLDIAGRVGGYNLQAAWSTGFVAGDSAASSF